MISNEGRSKLDLCDICIYTPDTVLRVQVPVNTSEPQKPLSTPDQVDSVDFQQVSVKTP